MTIKTNQGQAEAIQFDDGEIGWQLVDPTTGSLLGFVQHDGTLSEVFGLGNRTFERVEATAAHRQALQSAVNRTAFDGDLAFRAVGFPAQIPDEI